MPDSRQSEPLDFGPGDQPIQSVPPNTPATSPVYNLTLSARKVPSPTDPTKEFVELYYSGDPQVMPEATDGLLDMRIPPGGCRIVLTLDPDIQWKFAQANEVMTLGQGMPMANYPRLGYESNRKIWFDAIYLDKPVGTPPDPHHYSLFIDILQQNGTNPIKIKIDPDILNPGDHH